MSAHGRLQRPGWLGAERYPRGLVTLRVIGVVFGALFAWKPTGLYPWLKAFHLIAAIAWMAALLYLPRLFVYHCGAEAGSKQSETFKIMERRLFGVIGNPAMAVTWALGLWLAWEAGSLRSGWFIGKLMLVLALTTFHGLCARWMAGFAADRNVHSQVFYRAINELPTLLMVGIVILVTVKPF